MPRRSHLVLSVVVLVLALSIGWLVRVVRVAEEPAVASKPAPVLERGPGVVVQEPASGLSLPTPPSNPAEAESARTIAPVSAPAANSPATTSDAELADALWVSGTVRIPAGTPADERAEVVADGRAFESRPLHRAPIGADGSFRVAFSKATTHGRLRVEGRYLYSPEPLSLKVTGPHEDILLEPALGGCIRGRFILPPNALALAATASGTTVEFRRCSSHTGPIGFRRDLAVRTDDRLEFEIDHLAATSCWAISARPDGFVPIRRDEISLKPGAITGVEIELRLGVRIRGRVQDESGAPVDEVRFESTREGVGETRADDLSSIRSDIDGTFDCAGLVPGDITLTARKEGYLSAAFSAGKLSDGAVRSDVVLVLSLGKRIAGRAQWPDGRPVIAAEIDLSQVGAASDSFGGSPRDRQATTDDDGSFEITGLESGPCTVTAHAVREHEADSKSADPAPASSASSLEVDPRSGSDDEWLARIEGVAAGQSDLVLVLQPGKSIQGRVVDDTGRPIESFSIEAHPLDETHRDRGSRGLDSKSFHDPNGVYHLSGLHAGAWSVSARAPGFARSRPRTVDVPGDSRVADIVLPRVASISGSVTDAGGQPIAGAKLRIVQVGDGSGSEQWSSWGRDTLTDEHGRFEWRDLAPGGFHLVASAQDWADSAPLAVETRPAETVSGLLLVLRAGGRLTGEIFDSSGRPDANRPIFLFARGPLGRQREIAADSLGRILVEHLAPGTYDVQPMSSRSEIESEHKGGVVPGPSVWRMTRVTIVEGETAHISIGAPPSHPVRVHGVVTSGHAPVAGLHLDVHGQLDGGESVQHATSSDARGRYEVMLEEPGDWGFFLRLPSGTSSGRHETIPAVASFELDITLPSGTIRGRVVDPGGRPAAGILVSLSTDPGTAELTSVAAGGFATSDASGRFLFDSLPAGTFALATHSPRTSESEAPLLGQARKDGLVLSDGGELADIELRLERAGRIEGVVLGPQGAPIADAGVFVRDERGRVESSRASAYSDAKGRFAVSGLSPGRFTAFARSDSLCSSESAPVTVRAGDSAEVELALQPAAWLRVIIEDERGERIGSMVSVIDARGRDFGPLDPAGDDDLGEAALSLGRKFGPLPPGTYLVRATNHDRAFVAAEAHVSASEQKTVTLRFGG